MPTQTKTTWVKFAALMLAGLLLAVTGGCSAEDVRNDKPLSEEDKQYLKQMDDKIADEEKAGGG